MAGVGILSLSLSWEDAPMDYEQAYFNLLMRMADLRELILSDLEQEVLSYVRCEDWEGLGAYARVRLDRATSSRGSIP